jgi:hypothetical protein
MRTKMTLSVLLLSAVFATPTLANYFSNPYANINLNIGSAASPTPRDIRENRLPQVVHAAPSDAKVVADDAAKNTGNPAVIDRATAQAAEGQKVSAAQQSR